MSRVRASMALAALLALIAAGCGGGSDRDPTVDSGPLPLATVTHAATTTAATATMDPAVATFFVIPTPTLAPPPNVSATAEASGCAMSLYAEQPPPGGADSPFGSPTVWYEGQGLWAGPDPFLSGVWYAGGSEVIWYAADPGELRVEAHELNGASAAPVETQQPFVMPQTSNWYASGLIFPEAGCYAVSATVGAQSLNFVVNVLPYTANPYAQESLKYHQALIPYPPPASCQTTPLDGPGHDPLTRSAFYTTEQWIEGDELSAHGALDLLVEGENAIAWFPKEWSAMTISGHLLDDPGISLRSTGMRSADERGEHWRSTVLFPAPGCWQIHAEAGAQTLDATVYVYPAGCLPASGTPTPVDCAAPE